MECPFDQTPMKNIPSEQAADMLISVIIDPKSPVLNMIKGAGHHTTPQRSSFESCGKCGFFGIFFK